jgi:drug/metabolite transporter (DMT)-like permease
MCPYHRRARLVSADRVPIHRNRTRSNHRPSAAASRRRLILLWIEQSRGGALPRAGAWMPAALGGLLLFVGCHGSLAYAQQYVPSGLAAVIIATVPFWFVLLNFALPVGRRANIASLFGLIPGLAGVALVAWRRVSPGSSSVDPAMVLSVHQAVTFEGTRFSPQPENLIGCLLP